MTAPMPLPVQADIDNLNQLKGEAAIYINCTKPADGADVALSTVGVPAGGTWIGVTQNAAKWTYKPTVTGMKIEQTNLEVAPRITDEMLTVDFTAAEAVYTNLNVAIVGGTLATTAGSGTTPSKHTIAMGGLSSLTPITVVLVSNIGSYVYMSTTVQLYEWLVIYNACSVSGVPVSYQRNVTRVYAITLQGYGDPTRTVGDHLGKYGVLFNPN